MSNESPETITGAVSSLTVHRHSFQTGVFEFIPLPFVDEWLIVRERRSLVKKVLMSREVEFEEEVPKLLADGGRKSLMGRLGGIARGLVLKPLRKVLRTVFLWLTIRRAVLNVVETYFLARFANLPEVNSDDGPITAGQAAAWGKLFRQIVDKSDRRFAKEGTRRLWRKMSQRTQASEDPGETLSREEVEQELEREAPGILADFDRRARKGLKALPRLG